MPLVFVYQHLTKPAQVVRMCFLIFTSSNLFQDGVFHGLDFAIPTIISTGTVQTRARYFLFVPWIYLDLEPRH